MHTLYMYTQTYMCVYAHMWGGVYKRSLGTPSCLTLSNLLALLSIQYYYNPTPIILRFDS